MHSNKRKTFVRLRVLSFHKDKLPYVQSGKNILIFTLIAHTFKYILCSIQFQVLTYSSTMFQKVIFPWRESHRLQVILTSLEHNMCKVLWRFLGIFTLRVMLQYPQQQRSQSPPAPRLTHCQSPTVLQKW